MTEKENNNKKDDTVFIGDKPMMNYVTSVMMQFNSKNKKEVFIRARGKHISKAVDVAEVTTKRFLTESVAISDIKTDSEPYKNKEKKDTMVSCINITLKKK